MTKPNVSETPVETDRGEVRRSPDVFQRHRPVLERGNLRWYPVMEEMPLRRFTYAEWVR